MKQCLAAIVFIFFATCPAKAQQASTTDRTNSNKAVVNQFPLTPVSVASLLAMDTDQAGPDYNLYKKRARTHRTIGLSLLGAGVVLGVTGIIVASADDGDTYNGFGERNDDAAATLFLFSAATGVASIPFMILAHANNHKARAILKNQGAYIPGKGVIPVTGITVAMQIGK